MKFCSKCGCQNQDADAFCTQCGEPLSSPSTTPNAEHHGPSCQDATYYRTFESAIRTCLLEKYVKFSGRATRSEYWYYYLFTLLVSLAITFGGGFLGGIMGSKTIILLFAVASWLFSLAILVPSLAVSVRRLHDTNRSGWNVLWIFLPIVGAIVLLVFMVLDSMPVDNQYGPAPRETR